MVLQKDSHDDSLLDVYLRLKPEERELRFGKTSEVAEKTGVSARNLREWCYAGKISYLYIGRHLLIDLESLKSYLTTEDRKRQGI